MLPDSLLCTGGSAVIRVRRSNVEKDPGSLGCARDDTRKKRDDTRIIAMTQKSDDGTKMH